MLCGKRTFKVNGASPDGMRRNRYGQRMASPGTKVATAGQPPCPPCLWHTCAPLGNRLGGPERLIGGGTTPFSYCTVQGVIREEGKSCGDGMIVTAAGLSSWKPLARVLHVGGSHLMVAAKLKFWTTVS